MNTIKIKAHQIVEVLMKTNLIERRFQEYFFESFGYLEGKPVVERINANQYRLITIHENYQFYKRYLPDVPFECVLKKFNNNTERYLELLKHLFLSKARSSTDHKYSVINFLFTYMTVEEIAAKTYKKPSEISKLIFEDDKYKRYQEIAIKINKHILMEDVVRYFKRKLINLEEETEFYLLDLIAGKYPGEYITLNQWNSIKIILLSNVGADFKKLTLEKQRKFLDEIRNASSDILVYYFRKRCKELLNSSE